MYPTCWFEFITTTFVFSTPSIRAGFASIYCWETFCLLSQIWGCGICCHYVPMIFVIIFFLGAEGSYSLLPHNFSSFLLLSLQCLFKFTALSYYCLMLLEDHFIFISFLLIVLFILLLNSSINSLSLYLLSLVLWSQDFRID